MVAASDLNDKQLLAMAVAIMTSSLCSILGSTGILWTVVVVRGGFKSSSTIPSKGKNQSSEMQLKLQHQQQQQQQQSGGEGEYQQELNGVSFRYSNKKMRQNYQQQQIYHRHLCLLSIADIVYSIACFLQPWMVLEDVSPMPIAVGNVTTCAVVGFLFLTFSTIVAMMNGLLSLYFFLTIHKGWTEKDLRNYHFQEYSFGVGFGIPLFFGILGCIGKVFNYDSTSGFCLTAPYPGDCDFNEGVDCTRGDNILSWISAVALILFIWIASISGFICTIVVFCKVRSIFKANERYLFPPEKSSTITGTITAKNPPADSAATKKTTTTTTTQHTTDRIVVDSFPANTTSSGGDAEDCNSSSTTGFENSVDSLNNNRSPKGRGKQRDSTSSSAKDERLRSVTIQAILYSVVYLNSFLWPMLLTIILNKVEATSNSALVELSESSVTDTAAHAGEGAGMEPTTTRNMFPLLFLAWFGMPLQGLLNFFVYIRPNYIRHRKIHPELSRLQTLKALLSRDCHRQINDPMRRSRRSSDQISSRKWHIVNINSHNSAGSNRQDRVQNYERSDLPHKEEEVSSVNSQKEQYQPTPPILGGQHDDNQKQARASSTAAALEGNNKAQGRTGKDSEHESYRQSTKFSLNSSDEEGESSNFFG